MQPRSHLVIDPPSVHSLFISTCGYYLLTRCVFFMPLTLAAQLKSSCPLHLSGVSPTFFHLPVHRLHLEGAVYIIKPPPSQRQLDSHHSSRFPSSLSAGSHLWLKRLVHCPWVSLSTNLECRSLFCVTRKWQQMVLPSSFQLWNSDSVVVILLET